MAKKNLYELLEVSQEASFEEIKAAMIRLGKKYATPSQKDETIRIQFNQIKDAYKTLSSPYLRASYDDFLKQDDETSNRTEYYLHLIKKIVLKGGRIGKKLTIKGWQVSQWLVLSIWQVSKQLAQKSQQIIKPLLQISWQARRKQTLKGWQAHRESVGEQTNQLPQPIEIAEIDQGDALKADELKPIKGWKMVKQRRASKYLSKSLLSGEKIMHQAQTHWFFYIDFGAVLVVIFSGYLLVFNPAFISENMPTVSLWVPKIISKQMLEFSVWYLGIIALLFIGLMMLWEAFITGQTTELAVTSKRILFKCGLLNRTVIEVKLRRFESITISQNPLALILGYGTIKITGMGGIKITVPNIVAPFRLRKILWQVLDDNIEQEGV